jgi:hypothetical protein
MISGRAIRGVVPGSDVERDFEIFIDGNHRWVGIWRVNSHARIWSATISRMALRQVVGVDGAIVDTKVGKGLRFRPLAGNPGLVVIRAPARGKKNKKFVLHVISKELRQLIEAMC